MISRRFPGSMTVVRRNLTNSISLRTQCASSSLWDGCIAQRLCWMSMETAQSGFVVSTQVEFLTEYLVFVTLKVKLIFIEAYTSLLTSRKVWGGASPVRLKRLVTKCCATSLAFPTIKHSYDKSDAQTRSLQYRNSRAKRGIIRWDMKILARNLFSGCPLQFWE